MEETHRLRRRRSRRRARKKQIAWLFVGALVLAGIVWSYILYDRRRQETLFAEQASARTAIAKPTSGTLSKNLILFIGRGYGVNIAAAARLQAENEGAKLVLDSFPETALVKTYSRNAQSADSAAAMSAMMTGLKVDNEVVSQTSETRAYDDFGVPHSAHRESSCAIAGNGKPAPTLLELAKASGRAAGIVTTARVTQPVAAAAYAHLCQRDGENAIASQLVTGEADANARLGEGVDVLLGGGWESFLPRGDARGSMRSDSRDLLAELRAKGYTTIGRQAELAATSTPVGKLLGLFAASSMKFEADRTGSTEPSLADMATRAVELLQRNANGYLLIVESGRIADAIDRSDLQHAVSDALAFDIAIERTLAKARELDPELRNTTVVVTADHDSAVVLNGSATLALRAADVRLNVLGLLHQAADPGALALDGSGKPYTTLVTALGRRVKTSRAQSLTLTDAAVADRTYRYEGAVEASGTIGSGGASDVMLFAIGTNAGQFHGTIDNSQVFALMRTAMGL